ncbi:MAG TPA: hypothetical protein VHB27_03595 [Rhodopila sp.]|uniref:hypothetical protein n=1 Tax=Rhodopila sp. TaxID=2480087 RepID=UPI002C1A4ABA|nr:hypothetical protein [Rhodopila sp.]HVY14286.1 hypothetical protein [Rhodopila sp.]
MALTALQRNFLVDNLGVTPNRGFFDVVDKFRDSRLEGSVDNYLQHEDGVLKQVEELRKIPGAEPFVLNIERAMSDVQKSVKNARRDGGKDAIDAEAKKVEDLKAMAKQVIDNKTFYGDLDTAEKALKALKEDPQRAHVKPEIDSAEKDLLAARKLAGEGKFNEARGKLGTANPALTEGKRCATEYAAVMVVKASAARMLGSMKGQYGDENDWTNLSNDIDVASAKAQTPTRDYNAAKNDLQVAIDEMKADMTNWWVTSDPDGLADLQLKQATLQSKSKDGKTIVDANLQKIGGIRAKISDAVNAGKWPVAMLAATQELPEEIVAATKLANRRIEYDKQRETTVGDISKLKDMKELMGQMFSMNKLVEKADELADRKAMRFEDGIAALQEVSNTVTVLGKVYVDTKAYAEARLKAEDGLEYLQKRPAARAGMLEDQIPYIEKLMAEAQKATGVMDLKKVVTTGPDMEDRRMAQVNWGQARATIDEALKAIEGATKLADTMKDSTEIAGRAGAADSQQKIEKLAADMRSQAQTVKGKRFGDKANDLLTKLGGTLDEAVRNAQTQGRMATAQELIQSAASLLLGAQTIQSQYEHFATQKDLADGRQKALTDSTQPPAETLKPKTDESAKLLKTAQEKADAFEWQAANDSLRAALGIIAEAEEAKERRKTFDTDAALAESDRDSLTDPLKSEVTKMIDKAKESAKAFDFVHATRFLANATARLAGDKVRKKAIAGQVDNDLETQLQKMMDAVGGEENYAKSTDNPSGKRTIPNGPDLLDELVKNLPDTVHPKVIIAIAKKRFNIKLSLSALSWQGGTIVDDKDASAGAIEPQNLKDESKRIQSAKKIYEMLALTPEQSKDNPSLKKVMRENVLENIKLGSGGGVSYNFASGGYYQGSENLTSVSGRPGDTPQKFGSKLKGYQKNRDGSFVLDGSGDMIEVEMLPAMASPEYAPANENDVDYFDFANVHETGHAVDDRMGFMKAREEQAAFGGWITHGSDIAKIAKQVAAKYGGDHADILEQYVSDMMIGAKVDPPAVGPKEQPAVNTACEDIKEWFDIATKCSPWWDQGNSVKIAMNDGRVYQEAYPGTWVSYPLSERTKGITGYQFRAPGEWFCELYASYHLGKLKPNHPARRWLSSLSL